MLGGKKETRGRWGKKTVIIRRGRWYDDDGGRR